MKIVLIGSSGMLGYDVKWKFRELQTYGTGAVERFCTPSHAELDITNRRSVSHYITSMKALGYDSVVNCAAYTDVARIETSRDSAEIAYRVNALGPKYLAEACAENGMKLFHFSTDYVFSDKSPWSGGSLYNDEFPVNTYGMQKLLGDMFIMNALPERSYAIMRIGCLYGNHGEKSFLHKFIRRMCCAHAEGTDPFVVDWQISAPTSTYFVANALVDIMSSGMCGTMAVSPSGSTTRFGFANEILSNIKREEFGFPAALKNTVVMKSFEKMEHLPRTSVLKDMMSRHVNPYMASWTECLKSFFDSDVKKLLDFTKQTLRLAEESAKELAPEK